MKTHEAQIVAWPELQMCRVISFLLIALGVAAATGSAQAPANVETAAG